MNHRSVTLTPHEVKIAEWVGGQRHTWNTTAGRTGSPRSSSTSEQIHVMGFSAELAFCKYFNVWPDFTIGSHPTSDATRWGATVDIKTRMTPYGDMLCLHRDKEMAANVYALLLPDPYPTFKFCGFARAEEIFTDAHLTNLGHGPTYLLTEDELTLTQGATKPR